MGCPTATPPPWRTWYSPRTRSPSTARSRASRSIGTSRSRTSRRSSPAAFFGRRMSTDNRNLLKVINTTDEGELQALERQYCSFGDTVHYLEPPKFFDRAEGVYLYDRGGTADLDLHMWYSAANFGYGKERLQTTLKNQLDKLPQLACQYLHPEKVQLATAIARLNQSKFGLDGRVQFNVGGSQAVEDSLKIDALRRA